MIIVLVRVSVPLFSIYHIYKQLPQLTFFDDATLDVETYICVKF